MKFLKIFYQTKKYKLSDIFDNTEFAPYPFETRSSKEFFEELDKELEIEWEKKKEETEKFIKEFLS